MKIPKHIEKKLAVRRNLQERANELSSEIEKWLEKNGVEVEYINTHVCIYTEPGMVEITTKRAIENA